MVRAAGLLRDWPTAVGAFWQATPKEMLSRLEHPLDETGSAARA